MTRYHYRAVGKEGVLHKGVLEAASSTELRSCLQRLNLSLITYSSSFTSFQGITSFFSRKINPRSLRDICLHLEQFERAGIPLKESLEELSRVQDIPILKRTLREVVKDVEKGILFSQALAKHPRVFDSVFVGLMAVGEKTGNLSAGLQQLADHLKWVDELQAQVFKALRYPLMMGVLLFAVVIILMTVLVPELIAFIKNFRGELPLSTRLLIALSSFLSQYSFFLLSGIGGVTILCIGFFRFHPKGSFWKNRLQDALPLVGSLRRQLVVARFCHLFAVMFGGGIDILHALQTARQALGSGPLPEALREVERIVREGQSLSSAFEKGGLFPPLVVRMIKMGEQTSTLHANLLHVKEYFDTSLKRHVDHVVGLIEPLMILSVGCVMAWIVYAVFLPLYEMLAVLDY